MSTKTETKHDWRWVEYDGGKIAALTERSGNEVLLHQAKWPISEEYKALIVAAPDLLDGLQHMQICRECGEGDWADCDGGRAALAAIAKARKEV